MQAEDSNVNVLTSAIVSDPSLDPYTVENMNRAMRKSILAKTSAIDSAEVESMELRPNYLYVRFLVRGKDELAELKSRDTTVVYFKHPLDYKPIKKPAVYVDPTLPDSVRSYFAAVPVDFDFGSTKYDVIKELFLVEPLDEDDDEERDSISAARSVLKRASSGNPVVEKLNDLGVSLQEIEWKSLQMTGNVGEREPSLSQAPVLAKKNTYAWSLLGTGKRYKGHLEFEDDFLHAQPLVGVRVTGGYSYYWREAHTNANGDFKIPEKWNLSIDYEANFDSDEFLLEDGHSIYGEDLEIENNNKKKDWNEKFTGDKAKWCLVWTAAYQYYYGDIEGLYRPRQNEWYNFTLDIQVYYKSDSKKYIWWGKSPDASYDYIPTLADWVEINTKNRKSREIYANVMHELTHSAHYENMTTHQWYFPQSVEFYNLPTRLKESYAVGLDYYFQKKRYGKLGGSGWDGTGRVYDYWSKNGYTGIVEDLMDNDGLYAKDANKSKTTGESVSGFTLQELEKAFVHSSSWSELKKYIKKNYPPNATRKYTTANMDKLFEYWSK